MALWPIEAGRGCSAPYVVRTVTVPPIGNRQALGSPPFFDATDIADVDVFSWDWSVISFVGDQINEAEITATPAVIAVGQITIIGQTVQAFLGPVAGGVQTIEVVCSVQFQSGRTLDWGVELSVQSL